MLLAGAGRTLLIVWPRVTRFGQQEEIVISKPHSYPEIYVLHSRFIGMSNLYSTHFHPRGLLESLNFEPQPRIAVSKFSLGRSRCFESQLRTPFLSALFTFEPQTDHGLLCIEEERLGLLIRMDCFRRWTFLKLKISVHRLITRRVRLFLVFAL